MFKSGQLRHLFWPPTQAAFKGDLECKWQRGLASTLLRTSEVPSLGLTLGAGLKSQGEKLASGAARGTVQGLRCPLPAPNGPLGGTGDGGIVTVTGREEQQPMAMAYRPLRRRPQNTEPLTAGNTFLDMGMRTRW